MSKIILECDKTVTGLAGYEFGESVYQKQCQDKIDFSGEIVLVFPENIKNLASSFIQGFFKEIVAHIGIIGIEKHVTIISQNEHMKADILKSLYD